MSGSHGVLVISTCWQCAGNCPDQAPAQKLLLYQQSALISTHSLCQHAANLCGVIQALNGGIKPEPMHLPDAFSWCHLSFTLNSRCALLLKGTLSSHSRHTAGVRQGQNCACCRTVKSTLLLSYSINEAGHENPQSKSPTCCTQPILASGVASGLVALCVML